MSEIVRILFCIEGKGRPPNKVTFKERPTGSKPRGSLGEIHSGGGKGSTKGCGSCLVSLGTQAWWEVAGTGMQWAGSTQVARRLW